LVAFDEEDKIPSSVLHDGTTGFDLSVQRIHQRDGAVEF